MNTFLQKTHVYILYAILTGVLIFSGIFFAIQTIQADGHIEISTCAELQLIGSDPETYPTSGDYILTQDIDCADSTTWNENIDEWEGGVVGGELIADNYVGVINNGYFGFEPVYLDGGSFDGAGYTISNLWIFRKTNDDVGLFGVISNSTIENLIIDNASVVGGDGTGVLSGRIDDSSTISDITISDSMARAYIQFHGGMLAGEMSDSVVTNITIDGGTVHGSGNIMGGIVGYFSKSTITDSTTSADVDGGHSVGGAFGQVRHSIITNVHSTGNVLGEDNENIGKTDIYNIGGFIGEILDIDEVDVPTTISNSSSSGAVTVNQITEGSAYSIYHIGGFIGETEVNNSDYPIIISDSFTTPTAHVTINAKANVDEIGGFIGYARDVEIENSYAQGNVGVETIGGEGYGYVRDVGGFIGDAARLSIVLSFATGDVSAQTEGIDSYWQWNEELQEDFLIDAPIKTERIGGFIGDVSYGGDIRDSYATGDVFGGNNVGGFAGQADDSEFNNSYATGNVTGNHDESNEIGGFIGYTDDDEDTVYIHDSYATGNISGHNEIGGFVGDNNAGHIFRSYATGIVTGTGNDSYRLGGFVGQNDNNSALIEESYATGNVSGRYEIGGFVGENDNSGSTIRNSYARGSVSGEYDTGGFAGYNNGQLINVYSTGLVVGDSTTGGLVGRSNGLENYSFWDTETSGQATSAGGEGRTTAQMKMSSTFSTGDSGPIYLLDDTISYRYLIWYITENSGSDGVQVSELTLYLDGSPIELPEETILENTEGFSPEDEDVYNLIDDNLNTKWLDSNFELNGGSLVIIDLGEQITFDGYIWATANDYPDRDPVSWQLLGSNYHEGFGTPGEWNEDWILIDNKIEEYVPQDRNTYVNMSGADWNFQTIWNIVSDKNNGYPMLRWSELSDTPVVEISTPQTRRRSGSIGGRAASVAPIQATPQLPTTLEELKALVAQLQAQLAQLLANTPSTTQNSFTRDLQLNDEGEDVRQLQTLLIQKGYSIPAGATGFFGTQTRQALIQFQQANNITPAAGYFGPITRSEF